MHRAAYDAVRELDRGLTANDCKQLFEWGACGLAIEEQIESRTVPVIGDDMQSVDEKRRAALLNMQKKGPIVRNPPKFRGFTLLELMVTLSVAAILGFLVVPPMAGMIKHHGQRVQANELLGDLMYARSEAIKRGMPVTVCRIDPAVADPRCRTAISTGCTDGWILFIDMDNNGQLDSVSGDAALRVHQPLEAGQLASADGSDNTADAIQFRGDGSAAIDRSSNVHFKFCDARGYEEKFAVEVTASGRARIINTTPTTVTVSLPTNNKRGNSHAQ